MVFLMFNLSCCKLNLLSQLLFPWRTDYSLPLCDSFLFIWRWLPCMFYSAFSWISQFFQCFLPSGLFFSSPRFPGVQCPSPAVFLPVLSRREGSIHVSETLFLFLYLSMTLAIFTTMWRCWLMLGLSLTVTPTSFFAELLPNLFLPILYLHSLLSVGHCNCICWTLFFFPLFC